MVIVFALMTHGRNSNGAFVIDLTQFGCALSCIASAMHLETQMSSAKSRTIPPLRVSEQLRADAEGVLAPGEILSAFVMDAVSRNIDFRKSQLDFLARETASAERARTEGGYVPANKVIAGLRKRLANAQLARK
jgi:hypothetical protein